MNKAWLAFVIPLAVLLLHAFYYYPFFVDDAFISLRYADRFIHGLGLTWNDGEHVEGYSNLLWVLLTSGLGYVGFDLLAAARVVCLLSSMATMLAFCHYARAKFPGKPAVLFIGNLAFALTAPVAIWSMGGLEATLTMALLAWAYVLAISLLEAPDKKTAIIVGILLGFICITRPEGAFFTMAIAAGLLLCARYNRRKLLPSLIILCAIPFIFFAAQVAFRLSYYGYPFPNSYYAKVAFGSYARLLNGFMYVFKALASFLPLLLVLLLNIDKLRQTRNAPQKRIILFLSFVSAAWIVMLVIGGGDIFAGYRHILPIVPAIVLMLTEVSAIAYDSGRAQSTHIFCGYLLVCFFWLQCVFDENVNAKEEHWEWQTKELGEWLATNYHDAQPLIAASNTGAIPYYSKLPTLDMFGINDGYLTHHRSKIFGQGFQGHELFDSDYVLSRKPDIIIFFTGIGSLYGSDIFEKKDFKENYQPRKIQLPSYTAEIWVRKDSKKANP